MKNLQNLNTGDKIFYSGKLRTIIDWLCFKEKQFALDGTTIYSIPILDGGQPLDWIWWDEVLTDIELKNFLMNEVITNRDFCLCGGVFQGNDIDGYKCSECGSSQD